LTSEELSAKQDSPKPVLSGGGAMDDETLSTLAEELSKAQDEMLAESLQYGKPTLWARFNNWLYLG